MQVRKTYLAVSFPSRVFIYSVQTLGLLHKFDTRRNAVFDLWAHSIREDLRLVFQCPNQKGKLLIK